MTLIAAVKSETGIWISADGRHIGSFCGDSWGTLIGKLFRLGDRLVWAGGHGRWWVATGTPDSCHGDVRGTPPTFTHLDPADPRVDMRRVHLTSENTDRLARPNEPGGPGGQEVPGSNPGSPTTKAVVRKLFDNSADCLSGSFVSA
jgi:hypothetical protein